MHGGIPAFPEVIHPPIGAIEVEVNHAAVRGEVPHFGQDLVREQVAHIEPAHGHVMAAVAQF